MQQLQVYLELVSCRIGKVKIRSLYRTKREESPDGVKITNGCLVVIVATGIFFFVLGSVYCFSKT
jgi:hypothetical protein